MKTNSIKSIDLWDLTDCCSQIEIDQKCIYRQRCDALILVKCRLVEFITQGFLKFFDGKCFDTGKYRPM